MLTFLSLSQAIQTLINKECTELKPKSFTQHDKDGAVCDGAHHHICYEDDTIRVIDVSAQAGSEEVFHMHERLAVMYVDKPASIEYFGNHHKPNEVTWSSTSLTPRFNLIDFEGLHKVKNIDTIQFRAFRIEIKADILSLPTGKALANKILELVESQKLALDLVRIEMLQSEQSQILESHWSRQFNALTVAYDSLSLSSHTPIRAKQGDASLERVWRAVAKL